MCPTGPDFDDRHAQFLIAVADLCSAAQLAGLRVEVLIAGGAVVKIDDVLECAVYAPAHRP